MTTLLVAGSRNFTDYQLFRFHASVIVQKIMDSGEFVRLLSGGARGADFLAEVFAQQNGYPIRVLIPDWNGPKGKGAGIARNTALVQQCDRALIFWDGKSSGTRDTIRKISSSGKRYEVVHFKPYNLLSSEVYVE